MLQKPALSGGDDFARNVGRYATQIAAIVLDEGWNVRLGAASQNREAVADFRAYLAGRVAWVTSINPEKGSKLRMIFDRVSWKDVQASEGGDGQS